MTEKNNNSSSTDVSTVNGWLKRMWQKRDEIVFILETISMSLSSSGCHVAISAGWQTYNQHRRRLRTLSNTAAADVSVARNGFVAIETGDYLREAIQTKTLRSSGNFPYDKTPSTTPFITFSVQRQQDCIFIKYQI